MRKLFGTVVLGAAFALAVAANPAAAQDAMCMPGALVPDKDPVLGNVTVEGDCVLGTVVLGNVIVKGAGNSLTTGLNTVIFGDLQVEGADSVKLLGKTVLGDLQIKGTTGTPNGRGANLICGVSVLGDLILEESGSGAPFMIGPDSEAECGRNEVGGNLQVYKNKAPVSIEGNKIGGNLQCVDNHPDLTGSGNDTEGVEDGECAGGSF